MGTIKYPSEINIDGPWILNAESLEELHEIVESSWTLLVDEFETYKESTIRTQLDKDKKEDNEKNRNEVLERITLWSSYDFKQEEKHFIGLLHGDKKIISRSLKDLIYDPQIDDQKINGLTIELSKWKNTLEIEIDNRYSGAFKVKYRGSNDELKRSLFTSFNKWTKKHSPKTHVRLWNKISPEHWFVFFVLTLVQLLIFPNNSDYYKKELKTRAMNEIHKGDSLSEKTAIQILLELETGYIPKDYKPTNATIYQSYFVKYLFYGLIVCILLSYRPKTLIGIGGNSSKYKFMIWWIKIISVTIPSVILIPIMQSKLSGLF